jgi:hypothetical protein
MNIYLEIFKYAYENIDKGISYDSTKKHLKQLGFDPDETRTKENIMFALIKITKNQAFYGNGREKVLMTVMPDAFFEYLDYIELQEARRESKNARKEANRAQVTAIAALVVTIIIGIAQIIVSINSN